MAIQNSGNFRINFLFFIFLFFFSIVHAQATLDYSENFEGTSGFTFINAASPANRWVVGNSTNNGGSKSLYVSSNGTAYNYSNTSAVVFASRTVTIPAAITSIDLSFDWKCQGENFFFTDYDYFRIWLVPSSFTPTNGTQITAGGGRIQIAGNFLGQSTFTTYSQTGINVSSFSGGTMKIIFEWKNDNSTQNGAAAIDNLKLLTPCAAVTGSSSKGVICTGETVTLSATSISTSLTYNWYTEYNTTSSTGTLVGTGASINVSPTATTLYTVVGTKAGCNRYDFVSVSVSSPPSAITVSPTSAISCLGEILNLSVTSGGIVPPIAFSENFNGAVPWVTSTLITGGDSAEAQWFLANSGYKGISSNDSSIFAIVDSDYFGSNSGSFGTYSMITSLISPSFSLRDYSGPISLTFYHYFRSYIGDFGNVEVSTDSGLTWTTLDTYTSNQGTATTFALKTISLNAYAGNSNVKLRFKYTANYDWYWAIDNIKVTGTPLPTTITWSPLSGLYNDALATTPYLGTNTSSVYASPTATTTYTVSAKTAVGCPSSKDIVISKGDKDWLGINTNWDTASNWSDTEKPTLSHCVNIPSNSNKPIILAGTDAFAKNLTVQAGGQLSVNGNLTVTDFIKNDGIANNLVVASDGNLIQINDAAVNTGAITAKRNVTLSTGRQQYNYLISPVEGQSLANIYKDGSGNPVTVPFVLYHNETNNKFYASSGAYIKGRGLAVKEPASGFTPITMGATFAGLPTNGAFSYTIVNSGITDPKRGFNLIGNPYPSNIDLVTFYTLNGGTLGNLDSTAYFWDNLANNKTAQEGDTYGGQSYGQLNLVSGTGTAGTGGVGATKIPTQYVKTGQGFMVKSKSTSATVNFNNTIRTKLSGATDFFGKTEGKAETPVNRYWLNLISPANIASNIAVVYFPEGNNAFTQDDSRSMGGSDAVYSMVENEKVSINGRSNFTNTDVIPLGTSHFVTGNYTIALAAKEGIFDQNQNIYLKDQQTGTITNLSEGNHTFTANAGESTGRFEIIYLPETVLVTDSKTKDGVVVYRDADNFVIKSPKTIASVEVYDLSGKLIQLLKPNSKMGILNASRIANGMYVLKITSTDGEVTNKKISR